MYTEKTLTYHIAITRSDVKLQHTMLTLNALTP